MGLKVEKFLWKNNLQSFDQRRDIIVPGNAEETVVFSTKQLLQIAQESIQERNYFSIALSGGSTPNAIFKEISKPDYRKAIDWSKVLCFWSDERSVPPSDTESNYFNAMQAGISSLPLVPENIFRMHAETNIEENAKAYEHLIRKKIPSLQFDVIMLGMGEDGHTASLFPKTHGLHSDNRLAIANFIPQKHSWRMTLTYECLNSARNTFIYVIGANKASMVEHVFLSPYDPNDLPIQKIGTPTHKALWILDSAASEKLIRSIDT